MVELSKQPKLGNYLSARRFVCGNDLVHTFGE